MITAWPWREELEGTIAAPVSHRVLLETSTVRVHEVMIEAGVREPEHTHRHPGVMIVDRPARIRSFTQERWHSSPSRLTTMTLRCEHSGWILKAHTRSRTSTTARTMRSGSSCWTR